ncbi:helix-turn-helix transcriptional regulator [Bradyrhizobium sp. USDA 4449]
MHRVFQRYVDLLSKAGGVEEFTQAMSTTVTALDLPCFAYIALAHGSDTQPLVISTYPRSWVAHYLKNHYERIDPVVKKAVRDPAPFRWGADLSTNSGSLIQRRLLAEASEFGIRFGFTVPLHADREPVAAMTFVDERKGPQFERYIQKHECVLQLMAMYFHAHIRRRFVRERKVAGVTLSPREFECLEWASQGKSAWEIGCILGISRNTVADYLDNAKQKLGVRTVMQAVTRLAAANKEERN